MRYSSDSGFTTFTSGQVAGCSGPLDSKLKNLGANAAESGFSRAARFRFGQVQCCNEGKYRKVGTLNILNFSRLAQLHSHAKECAHESNGSPQRAADQPGEHASEHNLQRILAGEAAGTRQSDQPNAPTEHDLHSLAV